MIWSFSHSKLFRKCQRQWYFKTIVASALANDPVRREAYLLSKLQSVYQWRGQVVDDVIGRHIVPDLNAGKPITLSKSLDLAREQFDRQLAFARKHRLCDLGDDFKASDQNALLLFPVEYGEGLADEILETAWREVQTSLENLFAMEELFQLLRTARYLRNNERPLHFDCDDFKVRAFPDLVAYYDDQPPLIVDWKVHTFATADYRLQLAIYALTVARDTASSRWHRGMQWSPADMRLVEAQLLANRLREYKLVQDDLDDLEDYIARTGNEMMLAKGTQKYADLRPTDFPVTDWSELCQSCNFHRLCWRKSA